MHKAWLAMAGMILAGWLAGCHSPSPVPAPLMTVAVQEEAPVAPAEPLAPAPPATNGFATSIPTNHMMSATPAPPAVFSSPLWPSNWVNGWVPFDGWAKFNGLGVPQRVSSGPDALFLLRASNTVLNLQAGSHAVRYNGLDCWLGFAPRVIKGQLYIHSLDARKILQPLLNHSQRPVRRERVIVIDAGHGGADSGTRSVHSGAYEKQYTLDWALRLQRLLVTNGWKVVLTRSNDVDVPLAARVAAAEHANADLFISLHFNSIQGAASLAGVETYCLTPTGLPSNVVRSRDDDMASVFPNNAYDEQNLLFAFGLHRVLLRTTGAIDRGVRHARFMSVLRGQNRPAVLVEGGYLSNVHEARRIAAAEYRQMLAEAVARALE